MYMMMGWQVCVSRSVTVNKLIATLLCWKEYIKEINREEDLWIMMIKQTHIHVNERRVDHQHTETPDSTIQYNWLDGINIVYVSLQSALVIVFGRVVFFFNVSMKIYYKIILKIEKNNYLRTNSFLKRDGNWTELTFWN